VTSAQVECVVPARAKLGECPLWDPVLRRLYWIDIEGRAVHRFDPATGSDEARPLPGRPGSIALTALDGRLLVAMENSLAFLEYESGSIETWIDLEPAGTGNRLNDGRCDRAGRFWVGSMFDPTSVGRATGLLHRVGPAGDTTIMRSAIGVANGLAFSADGGTMYFADTHQDTVWAYDFDTDTGEPSNERVFLDFGRSDLPGRPDGGCVDAEGCYWIACVYGWAVVRVTPAGTVDRRVEVPVEKPTMPAFGGPSLSTLFVTSIGSGGSRPLAYGQPEAGGVFAIETDVQGVVEPRFAGLGAAQPEPG
jgi:sugar lactone lactonase YvrE